MYFWVFVLAGKTKGSLLGRLLFIINMNDLSACRLFNSILCADDTNPIHCKNQNDLFLLNKFSENISRWLSVNMFALIIEKIRTHNLFRKSGRGVRLSVSIIERKSCLKYLGNSIDKHLKFSFHTAEMVKKLSKHYSVIARFRHHFKKPVLL